MKTIKINLTSEQAKKFREKVEASKENSRKRTEEMLAKVPPVHFEILKYSNSHTREETVEKYPEHREFIDTITWGNEDSYSFAKM